LQFSSSLIGLFGTVTNGVNLSDKSFSYKGLPNLVATAENAKAPMASRPNVAGSVGNNAAAPGSRNRIVPKG
jgi:hypothetical protein